MVVSSGLSVMAFPYQSTSVVVATAKTPYVPARMVSVHSTPVAVLTSLIVPTVHAASGAPCMRQFSGVPPVIDTQSRSVTPCRAFYSVPPTNWAPQVLSARCQSPQAPEVRHSVVTGLAGQQSSGHLRRQESSTTMPTLMLGVGPVVSTATVAKQWPAAPFSPPTGTFRTVCPAQSLPTTSKEAGVPGLRRFSLPEKPVCRQISADIRDPFRHHPLPLLPAMPWTQSVQQPAQQVEVGVEVITKTPARAEVATSHPADIEDSPGGTDVGSECTLPPGQFYPLPPGLQSPEAAGTTSAAVSPCLEEVALRSASPQHRSQLIDETTSKEELVRMVLALQAENASLRRQLLQTGTSQQVR